ncbi:hypothetical protein NKH77_32170 [Streptomyces sp. M19]
MSAEQPRRGGRGTGGSRPGRAATWSRAPSASSWARTRWVRPLWWVLYGVGLFALLFALGGVEVGAMAGVFVLLLTGLSYFVGSAAWDDLVLRQRGGR